MKKRNLLLISLSFVLCLSSCRGKSDFGLDEASLYMDGTKITVELAVSPSERQTGLMNRPSLEEDRGMLFIFEEEAPRSFWMKNTLIPLSIAYINGEGIIIDIKDMSPLDTTPVPSSGPARYALEVNKGMFDVWGIGEGYRIVLPEDIR